MLAFYYCFIVYWPSFCDLGPIRVCLLSTIFFIVYWPSFCDLGPICGCVLSTIFVIVYWPSFCDLGPIRVCLLSTIVLLCIGPPSATSGQYVCACFLLFFLLCIGPPSATSGQYVGACFLLLFYCVLALLLRPRANMWVLAFYYCFIVYWPSFCDLGPICGCVLSAITNINRPEGATCSQTVYAWFLELLEVNVLRSEHLIYNKKNTKNPWYTGYFEKNKGVTFHSWGLRLIPESLASEVQAV